ncbi:hypothetical protein EJ08DRAFT_650874 [Tothia fuscella]|uniref:Mitochondrial ATPase inhibitor n=1 Tax=Tothia fuscella TaxID=1048955 RepID=A0A9P4TXJ6_9PEZI|nr:hypothetical protein EJ08DRAFT_650874 [Tothia fuscella]
MMYSLRAVPRRSLFQKSFTAANRATISSTAQRRAGQEDALHKEGRKEEIEHHKQDQLKKQEQGQGHWKDELASNSESIIKAERGEVEASQSTIEKLQKETNELLKKKEGK